MCVGLARLISGRRRPPLIGLIYDPMRRNAVLLRRDHLTEFDAIAWANLGFVPVGDHQGL